MSYTREEIRQKFEQAFETDKRNPQDGEQGIDLEKAVSVVESLLATVLERDNEEDREKERRYLAAYRDAEKRLKVSNEQRDAAQRFAKDLEAKYDALQLSHDDLEMRCKIASQFNDRYMAQRKEGVAKLEEALATLQATVELDLPKPA